MLLHGSHIITKEILLQELQHLASSSCIRSNDSIKHFYSNLRKGKISQTLVSQILNEIFITNNLKCEVENYGFKTYTKSENL